MTSSNLTLDDLPAPTGASLSIDDLPAPPTPAKEPSWYEKLGSFAKDTGNAAVRQAGLGARALIGGVAGTLDIPAALVNAGTRGVNAVTGANIPVGHSSPMRSTYNQMFNAIDLPKPETPVERVGSAAVEGATGASGMSSVAANMAKTVANPLAKGVLDMVAAAPKSQAASGAAGAASGQAVAEMGGGQGAQTLAGLAGSFAPSAALGIAPRMKLVLGGGEQNLAAQIERTKNMQAAGITEPSAGQTTGNRAAQATESALSKIPGGAGVMQKAAEKQAEEIGNRANQIADQLSTTATPATAGKIIEKGISGENGFIPRFKAAQKVLYDKLDQYLPKDSGVDVSNTQKTLAVMNSDIPNAPAISKWFKNAKIQGIEDALKTDLRPPNPTLNEQLGMAKQPVNTKMPYESIKKLRTLVGAELENPSLASDVPRSKWKALYASLSQDLDNAANATGSPEAIRAMKRANAFTRAGYDRIDSVLDSVVGKNTPEEIFKSATSTADMQAGATKISSVLKSLQPAERDVVRSAFIRRMGNATAGNQNAAGDVFSPQTFLTNWNKISPQSKAVLFAGHDGELRKSLDSIAKTAQYIREGSKVFANPSGTAPAAALIGELSGVAGSAGSLLMTGHPFAALGVGAAAGAVNYGANMTAKMMTNPKFTKWLATSSKMPASAAPAALNTLIRQMEDEPADVQNDVGNYIDGVKAGMQTSAPMSEQIKRTQ
jgi:hypothetical protein